MSNIQCPMSECQTQNSSKVTLAKAEMEMSGEKKRVEQWQPSAGGLCELETGTTLTGGCDFDWWTRTGHWALSTGRWRSYNYVSLLISLISWFLDFLISWLSPGFLVSPWLLVGWVDCWDYFPPLIADLASLFAWPWYGFELGLVLCYATLRCVMHQPNPTQPSSHRITRI